MTWGEFTTLLAGINDKTPLGTVVAIRSEKDQKVIKNFTPEQRRIRARWQQKQAKTMTKEEYDKAMAGFENMFKGLAQVQKAKKHLESANNPKNNK